MLGGFLIDSRRRNRWLVPSKTPKALAAAIHEALGDRQEAQRRAVAGQKLARELFDVRNSAAKIKTIYEEILS